MHNAYMIRSDGKEFPVTVHLYGALDDVEETLYAAEWLYVHTQFQTVKNLIEKFVAAYAVYLDPDIKRENLVNDIVPTLSYQMKHVGYKVLSETFINNLSFDKINLRSLQSVEVLNQMVNRELNQEFLRARYGGMYDSDSEGGEIYFRVSSVGFNWFPIIWEFVYNHRSQISSVTIVKDPESTGVNGYYYKLNGAPVDNMPVDDFINTSGRPVIDSDQPKMALCDFYPEMNSLRLSQKLHRRQMHEVEDHYIFVREFHK